MIECAVAGATGLVGQRFLQILDGHPLFQVVAVSAGPDRSGQPISSAAWHLSGNWPASLANLKFTPLQDLAGSPARVIFSALPSAQAAEFEADWAKTKAVFTNASPHRMDADVPLLIPEVNPEDIETVRGKAGFIVANGNCSGIIITLPLAVLHRAFGITEAHIMTQQALSGAGFGGVSPADINDNLIPYISSEEEKLETEPLKTIGAKFSLKATCTRVNVSDGHFAALHIRLHDRANWDEVEQALTNFTGPPEVAKLHSAPTKPIHVRTEADRPQPRLDRLVEGGMAVTVGRIRLDDDGRGLRLVVLGHNTIRGAAGQSVLNAEWAAARGILS